jgi:hypothetical protein
VRNLERELATVERHFKAISGTIDSSEFRRVDVTLWEPELKQLQTNIESLNELHREFTRESERQQLELERGPRLVVLRLAR